MKIKNKAFTLVELIIVITILAILTTIGFVSFQSYTKNTRDSNRLATLRNIQNGLDVYFTKNNTLPQPENFITVSYSGENISYQGSFGDNNANLVGFSKTPLDPLDSLKYTYSTSVDLKKYQVLTLLEDSSNLAFGKLETYAADDYSNRIPKTLGNGIGILLGTGAEANKPINFNYNSSTFTGVNIATNTGFVALVSDSKIFNGSDLSNLKVIGKSGFDSSLIGYYDMETTFLSGSVTYLKNLSGNSNPGTLSLNGTNYIINGLNGKAFSTTGVVNIRGQYNINNYPYSISWYYKINAIVNLPSISQSGAGIFQISLTGSINTIGAYIASDNLYINNNLNGYVDSYLSDKKIIIGNWNNLTLTYDGLKYYIYNNGILLKDIQSNNLSIDNFLQLSRGAIITGPTSASTAPSNISVDEVRFYNKVLTNDEIKNLASLVK